MRHVHSQFLLSGQVVPNPAGVDFFIIILTKGFGWFSKPTHENIYFFLVIYFLFLIFANLKKIR